MGRPNAPGNINIVLTVENNENAMFRDWCKIGFYGEILVDLGFFV